LLPSSQLIGGPGLQAPPLHVPSPVQAKPSSQGEVSAGRCAQAPSAQLSAVQGFPSPQFFSAPSQALEVHESANVQGLPSSQAVATLAT
jgi:hypothetical protein